MLGRGRDAPGLALNIRSQRAGHEPLPLPGRGCWRCSIPSMLACVRGCCRPARAGATEAVAVYLRNAYPEAWALFARVRAPKPMPQDLARRRRAPIRTAPALRRVPAAFATVAPDVSRTTWQGCPMTDVLLSALYRYP